jgi:hypothetical protein
MHLSFSINSSSTSEFIAHWSAKYHYDFEDKYTNNIGRPLTVQSRSELFEWKNGSAISKNKPGSPR